MKKFVIKRIAFLENVTFGVILDEGIPFALTLERGWKDNQRNISCIPQGKYLCKKIISPRFGSTYEVILVPGRSAILFHSGNISDDTHGCIILGEQYEYLYGKEAVLYSRKAFKEFLIRTKGADTCELQIMDL